MLLWADDFLRNLALFRILYIGGRPGGGKTSLSMFLAAWLVKANWAAYISSNIPIRGAVQPYCQPIPYEYSAIILDESWLYMATWAQARKYMAFVRKLNHFFILPSVWDVDPHLQALTCFRIFNGYGLGVPLWVYRWELRTGRFSTKGYFGLWHPDRSFGLYDSLNVVADDGGIFEALKLTYEQKGFREGRLESLKPDGENAGDAAEEIGQAAGEFRRSADRMEDVARTFKKRGGR